jgi:hypothetical protein
MNNTTSSSGPKPDKSNSISSTNANANASSNESAAAANDPGPRAPLRHLVLVLGDQLDISATALDGFDAAQDCIWMAEVAQESEHVWSAKQRTTVFLSAMRHFAQELRAKGWPVHYVALDAPGNCGTLAGELAKAIASFQPQTLVLTAPVSAPGGTAEQFILAARNAGDKWSYGSPGVGTVGHIGMELLKSKTGINPVHVPYPGYPQVANAMIAGELQLSMLPPALAQAQVKAGKLRAIGVTSSGRSPLVPDLPSMAEAGVRVFSEHQWAEAAAWLARTLAARGDPLKAGDILLTGALGPMVPLSPGDQVRAVVGGIGECAFSFGGE